MAIDNKTVSSWVRQARHRAKKNGIHSDLEITDIQIIIRAANELCSYCGQKGDTLDCPFPLKNGGPNVPANVVPCCKSCKTLKNKNDIVWMYTSGILTEEQYMFIIQELLKRRGNDIIKSHIKKLTGVE